MASNICIMAEASIAILDMGQQAKKSRASRQKEPVSLGDFIMLPYQPWIVELQFFYLGE